MSTRVFTAPSILTFSLLFLQAIMSPAMPIMPLVCYFSSFILQF